MQQLFREDSGVRNAGDRRPTPSTPLSSTHIAHFYSDDSSLLMEAGAYLADALRAGGAAVVIAEASRRQAFVDQLKSLGIDVADADRQDRWMALDASATLAEFMVDGWPDEQRFNRLISAILDRLTEAAARASRPAPPIAAYGEMVTVLWKQGKHAAAIRLEELWAALGRKRQFHLSCGWPLDMFTDARDALAVDKICSLHTHVLPKLGSDLPTAKDPRRMSLLWQLKANKVLQRVSRISRQTLGFYRDASAPGWIDLREAVDEVLSIYDQRLRDKNISVVRKIRPNLRMFAPLGEVKYVLSKLVANAFDSSFQGSSIYLGAHKACHPVTGAQGIRISVGDQGIGLTHALRAQVFSPFFAARRDINVGLGLWTVKDILDRRGGYIRCRSRVVEPSGTVMSAFLPVQPVTATSSATSSSTQSSAA